MHSCEWLCLPGYEQSTSRTTKIPTGTMENYNTNLIFIYIAPQCTNFNMHFVCFIIFYAFF